MPPRITVIGGGSYNWAPTIVNDILLTPELAGSHIVLEDLSAEPLAAIHKIAEMMIAEKKSDCAVHTTTDEAEALEGADFVIVTISTGGFDTMEKDLSIPRKYGVNQTVGDTVGPGGLARALRSIPVHVGIGRHMEKLCPQAWLINITNPMPTLCLALKQATRIKTIGLCHELQGVLHIVKSMLKLPEHTPLEMDVAGVNHFIWFLKLRIDGRDGFELLREWRKNPTPFTVPDQEAKEMFAPSLIDTAGLKFHLLDRHGFLPAAGDRHIVEFFDSYLSDTAKAEQLYGVKLTSIEERRDSWFNAMRAYVHGMIEGTFPLPAAKSTEAIADVMAALAGSRPPLTDVLNLPNEGQLAKLPPGAIVETLGQVSADSARVTQPLDLPDGIRDLLLPHAENQFLVVKAALEGDRSAAREYLRRDPLSGNCADADAMLDELLAAHARYLPAFQ
jgi:alpha-galactosidase